MRILAIDLGTKTGWALHDNGVNTSGTWVLAKPAEITELRAKDLDRCCDFRPLILKRHIDSMQPLNYLYFEDVQFATSLLQVQLWSSLRSIIWLQSGLCVVKAVDVGTLKKFATGKGNADKEHMAMSACAVAGSPFYEGISPKGKRVIYKRSAAPTLADDNEIDAWHMLRLALKDLKNGNTL